MDRDSITRTGARAPGVERLGPLARRCLTRASALTPSREYTVKAVGTKDEGKPVVGQASSECRPWSRTGENPPYGILGEAMETSASLKPGPRHCLTRLLLGVKTSAFRSKCNVRFSLISSAAEAVGKWESRALCGISTRGGKVGFSLFHSAFFHGLAGRQFWVEDRTAALVVHRRHAAHS